MKIAPVSGNALLVVAGLVILGGAAWFGARKLGAALPSAARVDEMVNPFSANNVAYQGAGSLVSTLTGGRETTVGGVLADWTGADRNNEVAAMLAGSPVPRPIGVAASAGSLVGGYADPATLTNEAGTSFLYF